jgi:16S rRNA processing protein RimM
MRVVVGRIGRAHGIRGDVGVEVRTDEPDVRFAAGSVLLTDSVTTPTIEVEWSRWHSGRLLLHLVGVDDRNEAEALQGLVLEVDVDADELPAGEDEYYDHQLVGLAVELVDGTQIGIVREVVHLPGSELLAIDRVDTDEVLVPFITEFVPTIDLAQRRIVITPPPGLLAELDEEPA